MDPSLQQELRRLLALPDGRLGELSAERRLASIVEAKSLPAGPAFTSPVITPLYGPFGDLCVGVAKPGKEAEESRDVVNPHDMTPLVLNDSADTGYRPTFADIFRSLQSLGAEEQTRSALEVIAALMARNAYMLDHKISPAGSWRYSPPELAVNYLESVVDDVDGVPPRTFLFLTEALALNEDVKYYSLKGELTPSGRPNNLLTCTHIAAVFLDMAGLVDFAYGLTRGRGVAPLSQQKIRTIFPLLQPESLDESAELAKTLAQLKGRTPVELAERFGITMPKPKYKSSHRYVFDGAACALLGKAQWKDIQERYTVKAVRLAADFTPVEDMSFRTLGDRNVRQPWAESELRAEWAKPFLFLLFDDADPGESVFKGVAFNSIPREELEGPVKDIWHAAVTKLKAGCREGLPKASDAPFFMRDHAGERKEASNGEKTTPLSFWLHRSYVRELILRARVCDWD